MKKKKNQVSELPSECTIIIVGKETTADGSTIVARSEDWDAMEVKNYELYEDIKEGPKESIALDSPFRCELPKEALGHSALAPFNLPCHWGSTGFNTTGVGMSTTESIFNSDEVLKYDPLVETGLTESAVFNVVLPYIHTAREGVERLGMLIKKHGIAEGFGIGFIDTQEIWYLETACGHRWLACRMPKEQYFITGNQSRFRQYDPNDKENYLTSVDLTELAEKHGLHDPKKGEFDFHVSYVRDVKLDTTYNYPRVWGLQRIFSPAIKNDVTKNTFPVYAKADKPIGIADLRTAFRLHYDSIEHDSYLHSNLKEPYRPVSTFRTTQTHILQVRPELPQAIGYVAYVAMGMTDSGLFLPLYQGISSYPVEYMQGTDRSSADSAYWRLRKVMTPGTVNYNKYASVVKETYHKLEEETDQRQREMEEEYLRIYKT